MVVEDARMVRFMEGGERELKMEQDDKINDNNKEMEAGNNKAICKVFPEMPLRLVVGYALTSKKTKSFLKPKLEDLARLKGIAFVAIDVNKPLLEQGPFDIVLHKLTGKEWRQVLESACPFVDNES